MRAERIPDISRAIPRRVPVETLERPGGSITLLKPRRAGLRTAVVRMFGVPRVLKVNLDAMGSDVWRLIDGARTVADIRAELAARHPGETELPRRLGAYFSVLVSKGLVDLTPALSSDGSRT